MRANFDYTPQDNEELELRKGDIITVIDKRDPNWWTGECSRNNRVYRGVFPITYTSPLTG